MTIHFRCLWSLQKNVWGLSGDDDYALAHAGIDALKKFFFETMGIPANLRAVGITDDREF